ncbi:MAG: M28 family peptidase [Candidatus Solibacter usitatus]|nr:M28 family peptidase [Candidatus Solibacter usitatus]
MHPFLKQARTESFSFHAQRIATWRFTCGPAPFPSAMPAPFDARFPESSVKGAVAIGVPDADWSSHRGKWIFVAGEKGRGAFNTIVRDKLLYQKAVTAGAIGFVFSVATPEEGTWQCVVPVDKAYAVKDERYIDGRRPIPCFVLDTNDANKLQTAAASGGVLEAVITPQSAVQHQAKNAVAFLPGQSKKAVAILCHLDSFFSGACDNGTGIAAMVGLAERLSQIPVEDRPADVHFLGIAAHHDAGAGMRAYLSGDEKRARSISEMILLEHVDVLDLPLAKRAGWDTPLNDQRTAYLGPDGWPEVSQAMPSLIKDSGLMTKLPRMTNACIADLFVNCGQVKAFCLMNAPPIYHTNHDTLEWISAAGIRRAVDFHVRLLHHTGAIRRTG